MLTWLEIYKSYCHDSVVESDETESIMNRIMKGFSKIVVDSQSQGVILAEMAVIKNSLARIKEEAVSNIEAGLVIYLCWSFQHYKSVDDIWYKSQQFTKIVR